MMHIHIYTSTHYMCQYTLYKISHWILTSRETSVLKQYSKNFQVYLSIPITCSAEGFPGSPPFSMSLIPLPKCQKK